MACIKLKFLYDFIGGEDRVRELAVDICRKFLEDAFGNEILSRCILFFLDPRLPSSIRLPCWRLLDRSHGFSHLKVQDYFGGENFKAEEEPDEMLEAYAVSIENGTLPRDHWLFSFTLSCLKKLFERKNWTAQRLYDKVKGKIPESVL